MTFPAGVVSFAEELRAEGLAVGTSELLDAFAALGTVTWTEEASFREALAATLAKSPEDRRVFDLVFERFFFRAAEAAAMEQGVREQGGLAGGEDEDGITGGEQIDFDNLREQLIQAIRAGDESAMRDLARLAIVAFGRRGEGSGVLGVDVQRIRRALGLRSEPGGPPPRDPDGPPATPGLTRDQIRRFEQHLRRELERAQIERTQSLPASRPLNELDRALPSGPLQDLAAVHRVVAQLKRRLATQGHETRGRKRHAHVDVRRTMRASLQTGGVPVELKYRPRRPKRPELYVLCDVSTSVTSASVFFLSVLHALHDTFRKMRSFVFVERISEVTEVFERERSFRAVSDAISKDAGVADVSRLHRLRARVARVPRPGRRRPAPARDGDRARRRAHERPRPARRRLRLDRRPGRPHVLAQPRAAAVLELRRLGDLRLRGALRGARVLDDAPARGLREGAHEAVRVSGARSPPRCWPAPGGRRRAGACRMTLATRRRDGVPWASPVWYAPAGYSELLWVSKPPEARHSRNLAVRPELAIVIFDSRQTPGDVTAVYMEGRAQPTDPERIAIFSERSVAQGMAEWPVVPDHLRLYSAVISQHWVLNTRDERIPVTLD